MAKVEHTADARILVGIDVSKHRHEVLIAVPGKTRRRRPTMERRIDVTYRDAAGAQTQRPLWPLAIGLFDECETLAAGCELRDEFRHFRLDRISALCVTDERLPRPHRVLLAEWRREAGLDSD